MIKIIKYGCEFRIPKSSLATITTAYDGIRITLNDRTDMSFQMNVSNQLKALIPLVSSSTADIITLNLDSAISGNYDNVLSFDAREKDVKPQVIIIPDKKPEVATKKTTKTTTKKVGRPLTKKQ